MRVEKKRWCGRYPRREDNGYSRWAFSEHNTRRKEGEMELAAVLRDRQARCDRRRYEGARTYLRWYRKPPILPNRFGHSELGQGCGLSMTNRLRSRSGVDTPLRGRHFLLQNRSDFSL